VAAVCLDIGGQHAGAIYGFMNTAANVAAAFSSVVFGYLVSHYANYTAPLVPMVVALCAGTVLWLTVDSTKELYGSNAATTGVKADSGDARCDTDLTIIKEF
jgi:predicted MFS family arabinose efflux permease